MKDQGLMAGALGLLGGCGARREGFLWLWGSIELDVRSVFVCLFVIRKYCPML